MELRRDHPDPHAPDHPDAAMRARARALYLAQPKPPLRHFGGADMHVALHVRRGDLIAGGVAAAAVWRDRLTSDGELAACAVRVRRSLPSVGPGGDAVAWHVFSEGKAREFEPLRRAFEAAGLGRLQLHLDEPIEETFHHLVMADALVVAKSSFSWAAAYLGAPTRPLFHTGDLRGQLHHQFALTYHARSTHYHFPGIRNCVAADADSTVARPASSDRGGSAAASVCLEPSLGC